MKKVELSAFVHKGKDCIKIDFPLDEELQELVKNLPGRAWSKTHKCWYILNRRELLDELFGHLKGRAYIEYRNLKEKPLVNPLQVIKSRENPVPVRLMSFEVSSQNQILLDELKLWMRSKRYSSNSIYSYLDCLELFSRWSMNKPFDTITSEDIICFNNEYILQKRLSASYQSHFVSAIKLLFNICRFKELKIGELVRPKKPKRLPNVLSKEEIKLILDHTKNLKHKAMLSLIYSCGLRCGELLRLKPEHTDSNRNLLIIKEAKGGKDRIVPLGGKIIELLREYYRVYRPITYLFEGIKKGEPYDERSLQNVLKQSIIRAGIHKPVTLHWLRHSYATHLLEAGTNLRYIQEILGHSNPKTTQIYTHVSTQAIQNVRSPFDSL